MTTRPPARIEPRSESPRTDRRAFLQHSAAAAATLCLAGGARAGQESAKAPGPAAAGASQVAGRRPGAKWGLGLAAYSFRQALTAKPATLDLLQFVDYCADHGLEATELTSYYFPDQSAATTSALRRRASVNGLAISGMPIRNEFCHPPGAERDAEIAQVKAWIEVAARLGAQTVRIFSGDASGTELATKQARCVECLTEVARFAGQHGVLLALENHGGITQTADQLLHLIRAVDSPWLGANLDTGNFVAESYESIERVAPYAVACQVKVRLRDETGEKVLADYSRIVGSLARGGYRGTVTLEYEEAEDPATGVPRELERLRAALATAP